MQTIGEIIKAAPIPSYEKLENGVLGIAKELGPVPYVKPGEYIGMEVEVEGVTSIPKDKFTKLWTADADGSLKDAGVEYKSHILRSEFTPAALICLNHGLSEACPKHYYGPRSSFHVHVNVQDLTPKQLVLYCLLYSVSEFLFFRLTQTNRVVSNFCVPVNETESFYEAVGNLYRTEKPMWNDLESFVGEYGGKYSAFGVFRLLDLGTVEFRHMHGNNDITLLSLWISLAIQLKFVAKTLPLERFEKIVRNINTTSHYDQFMRMLFGDDLAPEILNPAPNFKLVSECITNVKQVFATPINVKSRNVFQSPLGQRVVSDSTDDIGEL
jgi:hypothetical protein